MRAVRCSTRRVRVRKTPRALLARARGDEMLTRFQRAPRIKLRPFGTYQRVFVAYLVAPAYLGVAFFYPLPLGLQQPQAVPWAQEYVVYIYGSDAANCTGYKLNGHC